MTVPNRFPTQSDSHIALIGEAPGRDEVSAREPFVGASGRFLASLLRIAGTTRESCFLGNISQTRPPDNEISLFDWDGDEIQSGLEQLRSDLQDYKPNICVLLGNVALKAAKDPFSNHPLKPGRYSHSNSNWRGSLFASGPNTVFRNLKCMASYHPAYVLRDYSVSPLLTLDLKRAVSESTNSSLNLPKRNLVIAESVFDCLNWLARSRTERWTLSPDIEGGLWSMSCISLSPDPWTSYIIPFLRKDRTRWWPWEDEKKILIALCHVMGDPLVPKIFQNGLYDRFVLQYSYHMPVMGNRDDTMLKGWELNCELPKGLGVLTSVYTLQPYYKSDRKSQDDTTFYKYCGLDSSVTFEISNNLDGMLRGTSLAHYRLNMALLNPLLYMELRGIRYAIEAARQRRELLLSKQFEAQARLNALTGHCFPWRSISPIREAASELMLYRRGNGVKMPYRASYTRLQAILEAPCPGLSSIGEIEDLCERSLNVDSKLFKDYLYETLKLPKQFKENKQTGQVALTADYEALLKLSRHCQKEGLSHELQVVQLAIEIRAISTRAQMLGISADPDGRIRCGYNLVGSETGRVACYTSPTGSGYNLQTIPKYTDPKDAPGNVLGDRDLFIADDDYWFFQCDLSGADGWTVAAYSAMFGDSTMLDDYRFGLKPAKILALMLRGTPVDFGDRAALKQASKSVDSDDWAYFACKRVQHGAAYLEGKVTISRSILKDSEGKLYWEPSECEKLKNFYFARYPGIRKWHDWLASKLRARPVLVAASGQVRRFFGRPDEILTKAVAYEPQANTTYANNLALYKLWTDPENRVTSWRNTGTTLSTTTSTLSELRGPGSRNEGVRRVDLKIQPLHTIHDANAGQFPKVNTTWAAPRIKSYYDNELLIAGQKIIIPFEGGYGPSWGNLKAGVI